LKNKLLYSEPYFGEDRPKAHVGAKTNEPAGVVNIYFVNKKKFTAFLFVKIAAFYLFVGWS